MHLNELLPYATIAIQCHNNPDADALASGYGIYLYLKEHGKNVRLIYGGPSVIQKSNLVLLIEKCQIPIEYVKELDPPDLLLTVDCQYGQGNVFPFSGKTVGVIDHHQVSAPENLPPLQEIHSNYGSCSTVVYQMLTAAGEQVNRNKNLATALYYGLYTDTNKLQEISHPMDKDMRDDLKPDRSSIVLFQNSNLSLDELRIAGNALANYDYHPEYHFAIVNAEPCDPNILGVISDMLIDVDVINTCVAHCALNGGTKFSVRSCIKETQADELAGFIADGIGSGGGHLLKAGGFLNGDKLLSAFESEDDTPVLPDKQEIAHRIFSERMTEYFRDEKIIDTDSFTPDIADMLLFRKKKIPVGYVRATDVFPAGTEIMIRMLEGDIEITVQEDVYIMIGVENEIYPIRRDVFLQNYETIDTPYQFGGEYSPTVRQTQTSESRQLVSYASACIAREQSFVCARELSVRTKLFTKWDKTKYMLGLPGDYLVAKKEDPNDFYIVKKEIFPKLYQQENL